MRNTLSLAGVLLAAALAPAAPPPEAQNVVLMADGRPYLVRLHIYVEAGRPYSGPYSVYLRRWFNYLDSNGDGSLSKSEASRAPTVQQLQAHAQGGFFGRGMQPGTAPSFRELDADGDGKVTPDEFIAYYRRSGFGPIQLTNGNQFGIGTAMAGELIFRAIDTDGDGKLSKAELARAAEGLQRFDANDDEIVTAQEITGNTALARRGIQQLGQPNQSTATITGPLVLIPDDPIGRLAAAKLILAHYDKNSDGALSQDEIRLPADLFAQLDKDRNGSLNAEELTDWLKTPFDVVLALRLGNLEAEQKPVEILKSDAKKALVKVEKLDAETVGLSLGDLRVKLKRTEIAPAAIANGTQLRQFFVQNFKAADTDNKGYVTADQLKDGQAVILGQIFTTADRNGDGKLTEKELNDYLDLVVGTPATLTSLMVTEQGNGLFELLDANGDGQLTIRELRNAAHRLMELDHEGKGYITRGDIPRQVQLTLNTGPANFGNRIRTLPPPVRRGDGPNPRVAVAPPRGPLWFRKMDLNGDGDVSMKEWLGTPEEFKLIDEDGDGLISLAEAERYERHRQAQKDSKP